MPVGREGHLRRIFTHKGLTAGKGKVEGTSTEFRKGLIPLFQSHIIVRLTPDIACLALAIAAVANTHHNRKGYNLRPAKAPVGPVERQLRQESQHIRLRRLPDHLTPTTCLRLFLNSRGNAAMYPGGSQSAQFAWDAGKS